MTDEQLAQFVANCHDNGQKAGIYWAPFTYWGTDMNWPVENCYPYVYGDIVLKARSGSYIPNDANHDGAYSLDPTHPGTKYRIDVYIQRFANMGFDYIKLDFLNHACLEGQYYNQSVTTGMQAYNEGMAYLIKQIQSRMGEDTYISQAISPMFPYQYAHARRIGGDTYGWISESEYNNNCTAYAWWMNGKLYTYNDPDHLTSFRGWWMDSIIDSVDEAKTRAVSGAISGTLFLIGDDLTNLDALQRVNSIMSNDNILRVARKGKAFRPVEGNTDKVAPDMFVLDDGAGVYYIAVFNYSTSSKNKTIDFARCGIPTTKGYTCTELWSGSSDAGISNSLNVNLNGKQSKIYKIY